MIRKIIGRLTRPPALYKNTTGEFYISRVGMPDVVKSGTFKGMPYTRYDLPYCYTLVYQNFFGVWVKSGTKRGSTIPLEIYEDDIL